MNPNHSTERPRLVRLISPINATVHDLILVDSPKFHIILDFALNVEVYHLTIRGANLGSYDGIDAIGTNYYIHDNEVCSPFTFKLSPSGPNFRQQDFSSWTLQLTNYYLGDKQG